MRIVRNGAEGGADGGGATKALFFFYVLVGLVPNELKVDYAYGLFLVQDGEQRMRRLQLLELLVRKDTRLFHDAMRRRRLHVINIPSWKR